MEQLKEGQPFGDYTIKGLIAGGGMGKVYAANDNVYGNAVALKVLHTRLNNNADWAARFQEEGLVGAQLKHPHVLSARELVYHDGQIALVFDLISGGQTLEKVILREFPQGIPLAAALNVFLKLLQGIDYLHQRGVVHGDIKPENVMIEGDFRDAQSWKPKVTDFGTVALIANPVMLDGRPAVVATPRYASPEHLWGVDKLEPRSDIFCLGLLLHFLLTGQHASDATTVREAAERLNLPVPIIHLVDQPDALIELFQCTTALDPEERPQSCTDLALAVRDILATIGSQIEKEDVAADLATEVDEERLRMKAIAEARRKGVPEDFILTEVAAPTPMVPRPERRHPPTPNPTPREVSPHEQVTLDSPSARSKMNTAAEIARYKNESGSAGAPVFALMAFVVFLVILAIIVFTFVM